MRTAGKSKRSIARELGLNRETVDNILAVYQTDKPNHAETIRELTTKAFVRVSEAIDIQKDTDTARWALEHTVFRPEQSATYHMHGDVSLVNASGMVPASTTSTPSLPSTTSSTPTEAPAKAGGSEIGVSLHANFSAFSDEQLEQELARRKAARTVLDAEVIG